MRWTTVSVAREASSKDRCNKVDDMGRETPSEGLVPSFLMRGQLLHIIDKPGIPLPTLRELGLDKFLIKAENRDSQQDLEENESPAMIHSGPPARPQRDRTTIPSEYALQAPQRGRNSSASSLEPAAQGFGKWQREQSPECGAKNFLNYTRERIVSSAKSGEIVESKTL
ncbi:hypothetical protein CABS02_15276 [Colletotrichum abscissum]|uniref:Uncharacterized protein n=1 Tax=Colletotrichum abscissum TaxID=1671311 RepID=A0A9P9WZS1_9PEZI|nr:hypothetical protein CABS02_15276 [Colletotrichum abscissum]